MKLPDFSRYEIFSNGSTITVCDTKTNEVKSPKTTLTGVLYSLTDDSGKKNTLTERRIREAFVFGVSPLSFKLPRGGERYTAKTLEFARAVTFAAKAIESLMEGNVEPIQMELISKREIAIKKACAAIKVKGEVVERFADIAEDSLIERLRKGRFSSIRPLDEMLANEICKLIELSKRQVDIENERTL